MTLLDRIVTPNFVTWQAHMWFAAFVTSAAYVKVPAVWVAPAALAIAAIKEFYIDKHFETGQTFDDNLRDFMGYASGVAVGFLSWVSWFHQ